MGSKIKRGILSILTVLLVVNLGFIGLLILDGVTDHGGVEAANIIVAKSGGDYTTIQAAINNANNGDTIYIWSGLYKENVVVNKTVSIIGNGTGNTFINGSRSDDTIIVKSDWVNITGVTVTYSGNISWPSSDAGIELHYVNNVHIYDVNCSWNYFGILLNNSDYNTIEDNTCGRNGFIGIFLDTAENNTIENNECNQNLYGIFAFVGSNTNKVLDNTCNNNYGDGIGAFSSSSLTITGNTCNNNFNHGLSAYSSGSLTLIGNTCNNNYYYGISIDGSDNSVIKNNTCTYNEDGIDLWGGDNVVIDNNICDWNTWYGMWIDYCTNSIISNNSCSNNYEDGMEVLGCDNVYYFNNTVNQNSYIGIYLDYSYGNTFTNNTCNQNGDEGIYFSDSNSNYFMYNNFSNNRYGIHLEYDSSHNTFEENRISSNTVEGIKIESGNSYNDFYHNFIISNSQQATDSGNNDWSFNGEGNYWDDYTGLDNGANGRVAGDGIGDTAIPHPASGMDSYPFTKPYGWLYPGVPVLLDPGDILFEGNYEIHWNETPRCTGYILEESLTNTFDSPTTIYDGQDLYYTFQFKPANTYYYRVKGYNDLGESVWSNIVDIIVDSPPNAPINLVASNPTGHEITLTWQANTDMDLLGYHILMNNTNAGTSGPFHQIHSTLKTETQYIVTNLAEETTYHYVLIAYDAYLINSSYSNVAFATTRDVTAPAAPSGLKATVLTNSRIKLEWKSNSDSDLEGYVIYMNDTDYLETGNLIEDQTADRNTTNYMYTDLAEQTTYYFRLKAFDEVPLYSLFSNVTSATTLDETAPSTPTGLEVINPTASSLTIIWNSSLDLDVVGYFLYTADSELGPFIALNTEPLELTQYIHTGLTEDTTYYYKVYAIDDVDLESDFTDIVSGRTLFGPHKPEINVSIGNFKIPEDSIDDSINLYVWFKDVNKDPLDFRVNGDDYIMVTIYQTNGTVILQPEQNWNGKETLTFYAKDDDGEISDSVTVSVTAVNDPPGPVKITSVDDNVVITAGETLDLEAECDDPDITYGDELTYKWTSDISGQIGKGDVLKGVVLSAGNHLITLEVTDKAGESSIATLNVTVQKKSSDDDEVNYGLVGLAVIIIIVILILLLFLVMRRKKQASEGEVDAQGLSLEGVQEPQIPVSIPPQTVTQQPPPPMPMMRPIYPGYGYGTQPQMQYPSPQPMGAMPQQPQPLQPTPQMQSLPPESIPETEDADLEGPPESLEE